MRWAPLAALALAIAATVNSACGATRLTLPTGSGSIAADAREVIAFATDACRAVRTFSAEAAVSGSVNGRRIRARLLVGAAVPDAVRLEAVAFGQPLFVLVAQGGTATFLLQREDRVLERGDPAAVIEAATAVPVDASGIRRILTGCVDGLDPEAARAIGPDWRVVPDAGGSVYLHRSAAGKPWQLVSATYRDSGGAVWRADYAKHAGGLPRDIRLTSAGAKRFDLHLEVSQVELDAAIDPRAFRVAIPQTARPITLDELREAGPLGGLAGGR